MCGVIRNGVMSLFHVAHHQYLTWFLLPAEQRLLLQNQVWIIPSFLSTSTQVTELKERLRPMRGFWVSLPHTICNDEKMAADVTNEDRCWNGQTRGRWARSEESDWRWWMWGRKEKAFRNRQWSSEWGNSGAEVERCNRWRRIYFI